jgi:hypothetical protein
MQTMKNGKFFERVFKLHALLGSANSSERESAWHKLDELLKRHHKTWNDVPELLKVGSAILDKKNKNTESHEEDEGDDDEENHTIPVPDIFDFVFSTLKNYLYFKTENELVALSLWILHTFVFDRFMITPRLALLSPVRGCGKTTVLTALNWLSCRPERHDDPSVASLYQSIDFMRPTLLIDEADNLGLNKLGPMRTLLNSGHHQDGSVTRSIGGGPRRFSTFCPMAIAAIGSLPLPLQQRCIILRMERAPGRVGLRRLDAKNAGQRQDFDNVHRLVYQWTRQCELNSDPPIPRELHNRRADNWRALLSIADACDRGELARNAAIALSQQHQDEDLVVELLADIRQVFDACATDRLASAGLCDALHAFEDRPWGEWRGLHDNLAPRALSPPQLSNLLRPFGIAPRPLWPAGPRAGQKSRRGYFRHQFESAWAAYVDLQEPDEEDAARAGRPLLRLL